jgi:hypothetical protein
LFTGIFDTGDKFITSVVITDDYCSPVSLMPGKNVITGVFVTRRSLFTGVIDTGDKFIAGFVVTSDNCSAVSTTPVINLSPLSTITLIRDKD